MSNYYFPAPGDRLGLWSDTNPHLRHVEEGFNSDPTDRVVIASVYYTEDYEDPMYTLLLLNPRAPYYSVVIVFDRGNGRYEWENGGDWQDFMNIVPAVEDGYTQMGGDW